MGAVADRAEPLVGTSRAVMVCDEIVGMGLYGIKNKYIGAHSYLTWGVPAIAPAEGVVIVNAHGTHVGLFVNDHEFIHASSSKGKTIKVGLDQLLPTFGVGYLLRKEK